jgi:hypothetical protein
MADKETTENRAGCRGIPGPGRPKGSQNRATTAVREAIATLAEQNIGRVQEWLDRIATRNPAKATELYLRLLEYHVPRLARTELSNPDGSPLNFTLFVPPKAE